MRTTLKLTEIIKEWMLDLDVLPMTKADYKRKIELWFRWLSAHEIDPRNPQRFNLLEYKQQLQSESKSVFTVNSYVTVVRLFYSYCEQRRYYDNIGVGVKSSSKQKEHYKYPLTRRQSIALLNSIDISSAIGMRDKLIIALMLTNGLRTCEVARINIEDFSKSGDQTILVIQRKGRVDKRERVAIAPAVSILFEDYIACRDFKVIEPLFISHSRNSSHTQLARQTISEMVKRRMLTAGINHPKISAHSLRHTCGSLMVEQGYSIEDIKDLLGHSSTQATQIYIDMARQKRMISRSPSKKIARLLFKNKKIKQM